MSSEEQPVAEHRSRPSSGAFREFVASGWAPRDQTLPARLEVAPYAQVRRDAVSAAFPGDRLVIPAGGLKVRSNDCDYIFRPHTAFSHLTGLGADREPDAVLVLEPQADCGHEAVLFFRPLAGRDTEEFFGDSRYGEFWVGARPTLADVEAELGIRARHIDELPDALAKDAGVVALRVVRDADPVTTDAVDKVRDSSQESQTTAEQSTADQEADEALAKFLSVLRTIKDEWEIEQMRRAVAATGDGFDAIIEELPEAVRRGRGERWIEGVFGLHARHQGNGVGYESICASGDHANTLHWIKNTGEVLDGDLILVDAGVELDSLFTADITRTLPINGKFSDAQRKVYEAVLKAQQAGIDAVKPGAKFSDVHAAAIKVIAGTLLEWGLLPEGVDLETTLSDDGQYHRRWMVHGTSHHLGMDVHDCALALRSEYMDAPLEPGMVLTVEPGLYFKKDDQLVPEELRGIGVRIEDDVVVTEEGCEVLSAAIPREPEAVEAWIAGRWGVLD